jgi:hypothetical protein
MNGLALVAGGLWLLLATGIDTGYGIVGASEIVLGLGMGLAMAPATDAIMGSLPLARASVGSAVNDTTRTTGGALGVAVLGSILSSGYRGHMDAAVTGLPGAAAGAARDSLTGALAVAGRIGGPAGAKLTHAAQDAFMSGMHSAVLVAGGIALAGALVALAFLPAREAAAAQLPPEVAPEPLPA